MPRNLFDSSDEQSQRRDELIIGLEAIVAVNNDPEFQHRIKVVIPVLDEDLIYDNWVKRLVCFSGGAG
jgi:hypothetical protein